jgi:hypothetical protein
MNYDWLVRHDGLDGIDLVWPVGTLVHRGGGVDIDDLCKPGMTPATTPEGLARAC